MLPGPWWRGRRIGPQTSPFNPAERRDQPSHRPRNRRHGLPGRPGRPSRPSKLSPLRRRSSPGGRSPRSPPTRDRSEGGHPPSIDSHQTHPPHLRIALECVTAGRQGLPGSASGRAGTASMLTPFFGPATRRMVLLSSFFGGRLSARLQCALRHSHGGTGSLSRHSPRCACWASCSTAA